MYTYRLRRLALVTGVLALTLLAGCTRSITTPGGAATGTPGATPTAGGTGTPAPTVLPGGGLSWVSLAFDTTTGRQNPLAIMNLNPVGGKQVQAATVPLSSEGVVDAISPNGQLLAYHLTISNASTYMAADLANLTSPRTLGQVSNAMGAAVWKHDNATLAVAGQSGITLLSVNDTAPQTLANIQAATLLGFSTDDTSLFFVAGGTVTSLAPGALYRLPLSDTAHPVELTPREMNSHFLLSPNDQTVYYNNTGPSGTQGIYAVSAQQGGTPTLLRQTAGVPVGFTKTGGLLYSLIQSSQTQLIEWSATGSDVTLVGNLVIGTPVVADVALDVSVAPDGSGVAVLAAVSGGFTIYYTDLGAPTPAPKVSAQLTGASRADLAGWDTTLLPAGS